VPGDETGYLIKGVVGLGNPPEACPKSVATWRDTDREEECRK
jgi:hypothetical protein